MNGAKIIQADIEADNGIIHIIDTFLGIPLQPGEGVGLLQSALGFIDTERSSFDNTLKTT